MASIIPPSWHFLIIFPHNTVRVVTCIDAISAITMYFPRETHAKRCRLQFSFEKVEEVLFDELVTAMAATAASRVAC